MGSFPRSMGAPVLRIEDFETVARRTGDGLAFVLLAEQRHRLTAVRKRVSTREVSAVGIFRSHLRTGPFELTLADRDLLSAEFKNAIHVALLIGKRRPSGAPSGSEDQNHVATYFVSVNGIIQNRADPQMMPFEVAQLEKQAQAKVQMDVTTRPNLSGTPRSEEATDENQAAMQESLSDEEPAITTGVRGGMWFGLSAIALLSLVFLGWGWQRQGNRPLPGFLPGSAQPLSLRVSKESPLPNHRQALNIAWDHMNQAALVATKAHLTIVNPSTLHTIEELELERSELRLGSLRVEMDEQPAEVSLVLSLPDGQETRVMSEPITGATAN
jgi:hypothetical protein